MDERVIQFRVGVVVLSAGLITGILIFIFGEGWTPRYTIFLRYRTAPGVSMNTPVRKNGILIGRVTNVELEESGVLLTARIDRDIKLYTNEVCRVKTTSLIGDPVLEFVPGDVEQRGDIVQDGDLFPNTDVERDPLETMNAAVANVVELKETADRTLNSLDTALTQLNDETLPTFNQAIAAVGEAGDNIAQITGTVNEALQGENRDLQGFFDEVRSLAKSADEAAQNFNTVLAHVNDVIGDQTLKGQLKETITNFPTLASKAEKTLDEAQSSLAEFRTAATSARENLDNLKGLTGSINENSETMLADVRESLQAVNEMAEQLAAFTRALNDSEGTIGLLLNDPRLYEEFLSAVRNVEDLSAALQPVLRDVRVAADKIARDPGQLGIRGALDPTPPGAGTKGGLWRSSPNRWER